MKAIRFNFAAAKAKAAIHRMLLRHRPTDLHTVLKTCYFADKEHLNTYDRPVFGATYRAMRFGPVPLEVYEMLKGENIWLADLNTDRYPWRLDGHMIALVDNSEPDLSCLSETDLEVIDLKFDEARIMSFNERTAATHGLDWQAADLGLMRYEDMIDPEKRPRLVPFLQERAKLMRL